MLRWILGSSPTMTKESSARMTQESGERTDWNVCGKLNLHAT